MMNFCKFNFEPHFLKIRNAVRNMANRSVKKDQNLSLAKHLKFINHKSGIHRAIQAVKGPLDRSALPDSIYTEPEKKGLVQGKFAVADILGPSFYKKAERLRSAVLRKTRLDPIENFRKLDYLKLKPLYEIKIFSPFHASEFLKSSSSMAADCNGFSRYHLNKLSCGLSPILADFSSVVYKKGLPTGLSFPFYPISKDKQPPLIPQHNRFRPIGQVCNLIKGVVKNAFSQLDQHLSPIEDPNQFGFKSGNSVVSLVMTLLIDFFTCLKRCFVLRKYDISSAFHVWISILRVIN